MPSFAPYGFVVGRLPLLGDDEEDELVPQATGTPTTDWASLIRAGYQVVRSFLVEGIPYVFGERKLYTVLGAETATPANYTASAALMILEGDGASVDCDRQSGLASGRARDIVLRRTTLQDEGLLAALFKAPTWRSRLTAAVTSPTQTVFNVASTTGVSTGLGYIGRELVRIGSYDSTTLGGLTRGLCGMPHYHRSSANSGYSEVTDVPTYWPGRWVTEYEHLVSPEGRYLGDTWCTVGTYCRESWKGFVDDFPREVPAGKSIRCLPLVRVAARKVGAKITGRPYRTADGFPMIYWTPTDTITIRKGLSVPVAATGPTSNSDTIQTIRGWQVSAVAGMGAGWWGAASESRQTVSFGYTGGNVALVAEPRAWFLRAGEVRAHDTVPVTVDYAGAQTSWLVIEVDSTEDATIDDVPDRGIVRITIGSQTEVAAYDGTHRDTPPAGYYLRPLIALRLVSRAIGGTPRLDPWMALDQATVSIVAGYQGTWAESFRAMLTSSGLGSRGTYDVLGFGFGLGVPETWIDLDSLSGDPMGSTWVDATSADDTTAERALCGWLALWGRCLVQKRNASGVIVLSVVETTVATDASATTIAPADVLLGGTGVPELIQQPNIIEIDSGDGNPRLIPRDRSRMNAEGDRRWSMRAVGATPAEVAAWASTLLGLGDGQTAQEFDLLPGTEIEAGERRRLTMAHSLTYDYATGAYAPASIDARCVSVERSRWTEIVRARFVLAGQWAAPAMLCPSARVLFAYSSDTLVVREGHQAFFAAGFKVYVYEPGNEATRATAMTVASVSTSPARIQMTGSLPTWVTADTVVTFDDYVTCVAAQQAFHFVRSDKLWR